MNPTNQTSKATNELEKISYEQLMKNQLAYFLDEKIEIFIDRKKNFLAELCDKYGSDKGSERLGEHVYPWPAHTYTNYYSRLFNFSRLHIKRVFECGIGTPALNRPSNMGKNGVPGASLRVWRDYFPLADIYGADIDSSILFQEKRIKTYYVDQRSPKSIESMWMHFGEVDYDLIIDDGLHKFEAGKCLFENSIHMLSDTGAYIIEDVTQNDIAKYVQYFKSTQYHIEYVLLNRKNFPLNDNNLIIIRKNM